MDVAVVFLILHREEKRGQLQPVQSLRWTNERNLQRLFIG
jgi:hypothetical protein